MQHDPLKIWSRRGALICPHNPSDFSRCDVCNVIKYDGSIESLRDVPFDQLLICSPTHRFPTPEELSDVIKRMKGENALIELDSRTKFKKQRDYVLGSLLTGSAKDVSADSSSKPQIVHFKENMVKDRRELFVPVEEKPTGVPIDFHSAKVPGNVLRLTQEESVNPSLVRMHIFSEDALLIVVEVDGNTTISELRDGLICHLHLNSSEEWVVRWADDDDVISPDFDLPPIDLQKSVVALNVQDLCICRADMESESSCESD